MGQCLSASGAAYAEPAAGAAGNHAAQQRQPQGEDMRTQPSEPPSGNTGAEAGQGPGGRTAPTCSSSAAGGIGASTPTPNSRPSSSVDQVRNSETAPSKPADRQQAQIEAGRSSLTQRPSITGSPRCTVGTLSSHGEICDGSAGSSMVGMATTTGQVDNAPLGKTNSKRMKPRVSGTEPISEISASPSTAPLPHIQGVWSLSKATAATAQRAGSGSTEFARLSKVQMQPAAGSTPTSANADGCGPSSRSFRVVSTQSLSSTAPKPSTPEFMSEVEARLQEAEQLLEQQLRDRNQQRLPALASPPSREDIMRQLELAEQKLQQMKRANKVNGFY